MALDFFNIITLLSLFITIILAVFFSVTTKGRKMANKILSFLLILFALQIIFSFTVSTHAYMYFMNWHKTLFLLRQTGFLTGPFIYLYLQTYLINRPIRLNDLVHTIPFVGIVIFLGFYFSAIDNFVMWGTNFNVVDTILILVHNLVYVALSLISLRTINYSIVGIFQNLKTSSRMGWLQCILFGFILLWTINLYSFASYMVLKKPVWCAQTCSIYALTLLLFLTSIMFLLLLKPEIYYLIDKYKNSPMNRDDKLKFRQALIDYMNTKKPYLEPEIALEDVAKDMAVNSRIISQIINESFRKNFNGYMNEFRINEALQQLSNTNDKRTIQEILFDSGFNSISVFYTEFKKHTGLTPQEYRTRCNKFEKVY
jgi:AraC-like DNA-binding protein